MRRQGRRGLLLRSSHPDKPVVAIRSVAEQLCGSRAAAVSHGATRPVRSAVVRVLLITWETLIVVDPVPSHVAQQQRSPPSGEALGWRLPATQLLAARDAALKLEKLAEIRLRLQRQAPANLRHHVLRAVTRLAVLVVADLATFALMRALIRAARDGALFGASLAPEIQMVLPAGYLNGWQLAAALLLGLLVAGDYGQGDRRGDPARVFAACTLAAALPLWSALWTRAPGVVFVQFSLTAA